VTEWLGRARRAAATAPLRPRLPLDLAAAGTTHRIGSIEPALAERMMRAGLPLRAEATGFRVEGPGDAAFASLARWLHAERVVSTWRNELLAVVDDEGLAVATIERAAVRPLGIKTWAVHLVGIAAGGRVWVQQRAFDKATDPGRWDTLMGGQVAAGESIETALERETWEEAGLALSGLRDLARREPIAIRRPVADGYLVEDIEVYHAVVPPGLEPANRDGVAERLAARGFTLEATLILGAELERRDSAPPRAVNGRQLS
jgi:8-oxo-dGTP pyrophosphatase MutT (NUDIX family)